jgi:hypothetical protein
MAEADTWPSIKRRGLMSTSAVLDHFEITGAERKRLESSHRSDKETVGGQRAIVLRDQKPMPSGRLADALGNSAALAQWYRLINGKVFMWAREERLHGLLGARAYRELEHDVLTIDTSSLIAVHAQAIWLCPMNSGNTFPMPHRRDPGIFQRITDYPVGIRGLPKKEVVEVVVDYSVPDIANHVVEVRRMRSDSVLRKIPL